MNWTRWEKVLVNARLLLTQVEMGKMMPFILVDPTTTTTIDPRK